MTERRELRFEITEPAPPNSYRWIEQQWFSKIPVSQHNPEQQVVDDIDALINEQLEHGLYCECGDPENCMCDHASNNNVPKCPVCQCDWHGLPTMGCPGEFGTDEEKQEYFRLSETSCEEPSFVTWENIVNNLDFSTTQTWSHSVSDARQFIVMFSNEIVWHGEAFAVRNEDGSLTVIPRENMRFLVGQQNSSRGFTYDYLTYDEVARLHGIDSDT